MEVGVRLNTVDQNDRVGARGVAVLINTELAGPAEFYDFHAALDRHAHGLLGDAIVGQHLQLARVRRDAADRAAQLWIERRQAQALWIVARTRESCFALLRATAALVALTGGLFRDAAAREEAACAGEGR